MNIDCAGNPWPCRVSICSAMRVILWPRCASGPDHLDVNRSRKSEIQNLPHDIRRLEEEAQRRVIVANQLLTQGPDIIDVGPLRSGLRETRISPSNCPTVAVSLIAMLHPPEGRPMLSIMSLHSAGGMMRRMMSFMQ